jgi:hypothetical protein
MKERKLNFKLPNAYQSKTCMKKKEPCSFDEKINQIKGNTIQNIFLQTIYNT